MPHPISRRRMLQVTGAVAAASVLPRMTRAQEPARKKIPVGLQLYSVRDQMAKDVTGTIEAIGKMGFDAVEFAGYFAWDKKPADLKKLLSDNGLRCCGTHTPLLTLIGDHLKSTVELHRTLGNNFLICPSLQAKTAQGWIDQAKHFNDIAARAAESGMFVGYHSHASDFKTYDGKTAWEIFFDNTDKPVIHQLDTGNTLDGGGDPLALIRKYPGRTRTTHVKEHGGGPDTPLGEGKIDWKPLLEAYQTVGGVEVYVIEHETSHDPLKTVKACLDNFRKLQSA